jgi:DNA polymerase
MATSNLQAAYLRDLKNYLIFLKDCGYTEVPLQKDIGLIPATAGKPLTVLPRKDLPEMARKSTKFAAAELNKVREELGDCTRCKLCEGRKNIVFGSGNPNADLVFVGEGPGADEDEQGFPFVGRAGKKLTEIIEKGMGLDREKDAYICNIVKCRPPGNRDPESAEVEACKPFLEKQIQAIRPKVIVALGKPAASTLLGRAVAITKERGTWHEYLGTPLMLTFHPAYLLRAYTLENRRLVHNDMKMVLTALKK